MFLFGVDKENERKLKKWALILMTLPIWGTVIIVGLAVFVSLVF